MKTLKQEEIEKYLKHLTLIGKDDFEKFDNKNGETWEFNLRFDELGEMKGLDLKEIQAIFVIVEKLEDEELTQKEKEVFDLIDEELEYEETLLCDIMLVKERTDRPIKVIFHKVSLHL